MNSNLKIPSWIKWSVGVVIGLIGAAGGAVAVFEYLDAKQANKEKIYEREMAEWKTFAPPPIGQNERVEMMLGWYLDLDKGLIAMSLIGKKWDLKTESDLIIHDNRAVGTKWEGMRVNSNVQWTHIGVADYDLIGYREIRDAKFQSGNWVYQSHPTAAPGPGYIFAIKTSEGNVAKLQILDYKPHNSYSRKIFLRYVVYPVVADPPRPRRP